MKTISKAILATSIAIFPLTGFCQLSDSAARNHAAVHATNLGIQFDREQAELSRSGQYIFVEHNGKRIALNCNNGRLKSFQQTIRAVAEDANAPSHFQADGAVIERAMFVMSKFPCPPGLSCEYTVWGQPLLRYVPGVSLPVVECYFVQHPNGYLAMSGNHVYMKFDMRRGRVTSMDIAEGWQYESPRIVVSGLQAKETASSILGGAPSEWQPHLTYQPGSSDGPREIYELTLRHIQRLCYEMRSQWGTVIVDSVTGEVVFAGSPSGAVNASILAKNVRKANINAARVSASLRGDVLRIAELLLAVAGFRTHFTTDTGLRG
ncbi:MAG: hypothetical protein ABL962_14495 [Fimbriimonadaceae bacterium]